MSVEYVLVLFSFVFLLMGALIKGPKASFAESGPKLGARVERMMHTGSGWGLIEWEKPITNY